MAYAAMGATLTPATAARTTHLTLRAGESPSRRYIRWLAEQGITSTNAKKYVTDCVLGGGKSRGDPAAVQVCIDQYRAAMAPTEVAPLMPMDQEALFDEEPGIPKWMIGVGVGAVVLGGLVLLRRK